MMAVERGWAESSLSISPLPQLSFATALFSVTAISSADTTGTSELAQVLASMASVATDYISVGGNRHPGAADWDVQSGVLAFGADNNVALWEPMVCPIECSGFAYMIAAELTYFLG